MPDETPTMERSAVVDRIEGARAVILVGPDETELVLPVDRLPEGAGEGSWLRISFDVGAIEDDPTAQRGAEARVADKRERLRRRGRRLSD